VETLNAFVPIATLALLLFLFFWQTRNPSQPESSRYLIRLENDNRDLKIENAQLKALLDACRDSERDGRRNSTNTVKIDNSQRGGDNINVGDISDAKSVAVGRGASTKYNESVTRNKPKGKRSL